MKNDENSSNLNNPDAGSSGDSKYLTYQEKKLRKKGAARGALITAIISFIVLVLVVLVYNSRYNKEKEEQTATLEEQKANFNEQLTAREAEINSWLVTFNQIENDLAVIKQKENLISLKSSEKKLTKDKKEQVLADFKYITTLLEQNRSKIASLNDQLKKSGNSIKGFQSRVAELENSIKTSENEIADLRTTLGKKDIEIGTLNTRMTGLQATISQQEEKIVNQTDEMNKGFIVAGTYKDLKEKGIVLKEGGFLGLGKKETLASNFPDSSFARINVTETKTIPVNSREVKLISDHPEGSYELVRDNNKIAYIEIKDPGQFWKVSKYAVVEIVK